MDAEHIAVADTAVDLCTSLDIIEHIIDVGGYLREVGRISEYALFKIPLEDCWLMRINDRLGSAFRRDTWSGHLRRFNISSALKAIESSGFILNY